MRVNQSLHKTLHFAPQNTQPLLLRALKAMPGSLWLVGYPILGKVFSLLAGVIALYLLFSPFTLLLGSDFNQATMLRTALLAILAAAATYPFATACSAFFDACLWGRAHENLCNKKPQGLHTGLRYFLPLFGLKLLFHLVNAVWALLCAAALAFGLKSSLMGAPNLISCVIFVPMSLLVFALLQILERQAQAAIFVHNAQPGEAILSAVQATLKHPAKVLAVFLILTLFSTIIDLHELIITLAQWMMLSSVHPGLTLTTQGIVLLFAAISVVLSPLMWLCSIMPGSNLIRAKTVRKSRRTINNASPVVARTTSTQINANDEKPYDFAVNSDNIQQISKLLAEDETN